MAHRNVGFLEARKIVEKWSQPWRSNPVFSLGAESPRGCAEPSRRNCPFSKRQEDETSGIILRKAKTTKSRANQLDGTPAEGNGRSRITTGLKHLNRVQKD
jgi:hypothetical protein